MSFRPLTHQLFHHLAGRLSLPPVLVGITLSVLLGLFALWVTVLIGTADQVADGKLPSIAVRAPVTLYMMIGYLPMALYYLTMWSRRHHSRISRGLALNLKPMQFPRRSANWIGLLGAVTMYVLFLPTAGEPFLVFSPWRWSQEFAFVLFGLIVMGWFNFRFTYLLVWSALEISRTARRIAALDLFDASLVKPYAQQGVRSSLLAIGSLSISANLWLDVRSPTVGTAISLALLSSAAIIALVLPTWGIHQRLKGAKQRALRQVRRNIAARADAETRTVDGAILLQTDLSMEGRLERVNEWPFDASSYSRVALYIMLGLGSWVGAALVERMLESIGT